MLTPVRRAFPPGPIIWQLAFIHLRTDEVESGKPTLDAISPTSAWLAKITEPGVRRRAEFYYQQLDALRSLRREVRRELLEESKKHRAWPLLCQIPSMGPIRAAVLIAILQTPHRFRTKRQLWTFSGLGIEMHSSANHRYVDGQLRRSKKPVSIRGLNQNHNHDLKNLFKGAALVASSKPGLFREFYAARLAKGIRPEMARTYATCTDQHLSKGISAKLFKTKGDSCLRILIVGRIARPGNFRSTGNGVQTGHRTSSECLASFAVSWSCELNLALARKLPYIRVNPA